MIEAGAAHQKRRSNGNTALAGRHCRNAGEPVLASGDRFEVGAGAKRVSRRPFGRRYGRRSRSSLRLVSGRDSAAAIEQRYLQVGAVAIGGCGGAGIDLRRCRGHARRGWAEDSLAFRVAMADDDLSGFERGSFTHAGTTHELLRCGSGPAVIVIAEMPGITPKVLAFARMVAGIGCSPVLPVLFGEPGRDPVPRMPNPLAALMYAGDSLLRACISREFTVWATGKSSPVVDWLRALAVFEHERCGGPGVGAVGMCFTGGTRSRWRLTPSCSSLCFRSRRCRCLSSPSSGGRSTSRLMS